MNDDMHYLSDDDKNYIKDVNDKIDKEHREDYHKYIMNFLIENISELTTFIIANDDVLGKFDSHLRNVDLAKFETKLQDLIEECNIHKFLGYRLKTTVSTMMIPIIEEKIRRDKNKPSKPSVLRKDDNTRGLSLRDNDFILTFGTYKFKLVKLFYNNKYRFISSELSFQDVEYTPFKSFNTIDQCISDAFLYVKEIQIIEKDNQDE